MIEAVMLAGMATTVGNSVLEYTTTKLLDKIKGIITDPNTSVENKQLFVQLKEILEYHQKLVEQLEDSEFIRKRNLSLWLHNKLHETKLSTQGKPIYKILLTHIFNNMDNSEKDYQLLFFDFFKKHFFAYLRHNLSDEKLEFKVNYDFKYKKQYAMIFNKLQSEEYINELSADTYERKDFILMTFKKFENFYTD
jgi:hypothetical protein